MKRQNRYEYWHSQIKDDVIRNYVESHNEPYERLTEKNIKNPTKIVAEELRKALTKALK